MNRKLVGSQLDLGLGRVLHFLVTILGVFGISGGGGGSGSFGLLRGFLLLLHLGSSLLDGSLLGSALLLGGRALCATCQFSLGFVAEKEG